MPKYLIVVGHLIPVILLLQPLQEYNITKIQPRCYVCIGKHVSIYRELEY